MRTPALLGDLSLYWSPGFLAANAFIALNLVGAWLLGMLVGYERSYNGRAAGMRTYGLVCMASTALTVFVGHSAFWYGGTAGAVMADPTRVVQGVVTGVGFLGAGVIMKDGLSISGLTTAASIWASSAIGVLLGVGFYAAAILLALLCMASMSLLHQLESRLPGRSTLEVCLTFGDAGPPTFEELAEQAEARGYRVLHDSLRITFSESRPVWRFCVIALDRDRAASPVLLAQEMASSDGVASFSIVPIRH